MGMNSKAAAAVPAADMFPSPDIFAASSRARPRESNRLRQSREAGLSCFDRLSMRTNLILSLSKD
jgi:hypothetical protein